MVAAASAAVTLVVVFASSVVRVAGKSLLVKGVGSTYFDEEK